jgi:hypothetical protein
VADLGVFRDVVPAPPSPYRAAWTALTGRDEDWGGCASADQVERIADALLEYLRRGICEGERAGYREGQRESDRRHDAAYDALLEERNRLREQLAAARVVAWQEGWEAGDADATAFARERQVGNSTDHLELTANPYGPTS